LLLAFTLGACEEGGSGGGGGDASASNPSAVQAIELPAGLTAATLGWAPSEGQVDYYFVYESRNDGDYVYTASVQIPQITIQGSAGDRVRISVIAVSDEGRSSSASLPSPELRFHAADPAPAVALTTTTQTGLRASVAPMVVVSDSAASNDTNASAGDAESGVVVEDSLFPVEDSLFASNYSDDVLSGNDDAEELQSENDAEMESLDASNLRALLLESDLRFPSSGLAEGAQSWLQAKLDERFSADVRLVGTGDLDQDGLREAVWQDSSGQLLVSMGSALKDLVDDADIPSTFEESIRLQASERFIALADFDGDAMGDWLIEDTATGDVWITNGRSLETTSARSTLENSESFLLGHGDFNGDGRHEMLWQHADGAIRFGHPSTDLAGLDVPGHSIPLATSSLLVAVADMNGDGNDDLISIDENGRLEWTLVTPHSGDNGSALFEARLGPDLTTDALELLATLDIDDDGQAEIAWLNRGEIEVWDATTGPQDE